jgi:hypothetical protein
MESNNNEPSQYEYDSFVVPDDYDSNVEYREQERRLSQSQSNATNTQDVQVHESILESGDANTENISRSQYTVTESANPSEYGHYGGVVGFQRTVDRIAARYNVVDPPPRPRAQIASNNQMRFTSSEEEDKKQGEKRKVDMQVDSDNDSLEPFEREVHERNTTYIREADPNPSPHKKVNFENMDIYQNIL